MPVNDDQYADPCPLELPNQTKPPVPPSHSIRNLWLIVGAIVAGGALIIGLIISLAAGSSSPTPGTDEGPDLPAAQSEDCVDCDGGVMPADSAETPGPERSDRGAIVTALGQEGTLTDLAIDQEVVTFAVDAIGPAECKADYAEYGSPPVNGNLIALDLRVATAPELAQSTWGSYFTISPGDFQFVDSDGITHSELWTAATFSCLADSDKFTSDPLTPGSQYIGKIVLDLPDANGTLIYRPVMVSGGGWEWSF